MKLLYNSGITSLAWNDLQIFFSGLKGRLNVRDNNKTISKKK